MPLLTHGQRLGAYIIHDLLGEGGMAEVYRATHAALDRAVAIKVLNPSFSRDPTFPLRFRREAKVYATLNHPNIVHVYDFDETEEIAYLVMELATGGALSQRTGCRTTLRQAIDALGPVFDAVEFAHNRGVVHRDIKPENVLLTEQQRPLLADFGLARLRSETSGMEESGTILGTPHYMAPEQVLGGHVDGRADIYALGILTYVSIAGRVPFDGSSFTAIARRHLKLPPPSIREVFPAAPDRLDAAIQRATAKAAAERFASAAAFYAELRRAVAEAPDLPVGATDGASPIARSPFSAVYHDPHRTAAGTAPSISSVLLDSASGGQCPTCRSAVRPEARFYTTCGGRVPALLPSGAPFSFDDDIFGCLFDGPQIALDPGSDPAAVPAPRRPSLPSGVWQRGALVLPAVAVVLINAIGLWAARSGVNPSISASLLWLKSGMALITLLLAGLASGAIWAVTVDRRARSPASYRWLRRLHRQLGYLVAISAFSIGLLSCAGVRGFDLSTPRQALHSRTGTALLVLIVAKVTVVRRVRCYRRHLDVLGAGVVIAFGLTVVSGVLPRLVGQVTGSG